MFSVYLHPSYVCLGLLQAFIGHLQFHLQFCALLLQSTDILQLILLQKLNLLLHSICRSLFLLHLGCCLLLLLLTGY